MQDTFRQFKAYLARVRDLQMASAVLAWDRETYLPPAGAAARARQLGSLSEMAHELFVDDRVGEWLAALQPYEDSLPFDSDDASLIRVARRDYEKERRVPSQLVGDLARAASLGQQTWVDARQAADFARFQPSLETLVDLRLAWANCFDYQDSIYDPLLDHFEPGLTAAQVRRIFDAFRPPLVELVAAIGERHDRVDDACLQGDFDEAAQWELGLQALTLMGYDFNRGRQDRAAHPFTTHFSSDDVRLTTRFDPHNISSALFGSIHEGGHALYELGVSPALDDTLLGEGASMVLHESQSRLFENVVGRGRPFWHHFYPRLQARFPQFRAVDLETFYRAVNRVTPSFIRVEADEVTYGLHIILRFELEEALVTRQLAVADLPAAWNAKMQAYLGLIPPDDALGVLQDIHWSAGMIGYFPDYLLGSMLSVQLYERAQADLPDLESQLERGQLAPLRGWMADHVHQHGRKFTLDELTDRVLGAPLSPAPYLAYLRQRYGEIYGL
jgi:carboxypeptidase Taq